MPTKGKVPAALAKFQFKKGGGRVGTATPKKATTKTGTSKAAAKKSTKKSTKK